MLESVRQDGDGTLARLTRRVEARDQPPRRRPRWAAGAYNVLMVEARYTLPQLFALEVAKSLPPGAGEGVLRAAYDAAEEPGTPEDELGRYYRLCDKMTEWAEAALRRVGLVDYATFLRQARGRGADGAAMAAQTLSTARRVLDSERYATAPDQAFVLAARRTLLETQKALNVASRVSDPRAERQVLRGGTATAARAFVAAWGFFGGAPAEARATVAAMRTA